MYTVKQLADLAGVSVRTLHYYDEIGLLKPSSIGANGYRHYGDEAVFRLQQILFFREMDLSLNEIKEIIDLPRFDLLTALQAHRARLQAKTRRLRDLIDTVDNTILHLTGEIDMGDKKKLFTGFTKEEEQRYAEEARQLWGSEEVDASYKRWNSYSTEKQAAIKAEGGAIYQALAEVIDKGPDSPEAQGGIARWHQHMRYFYEPSVERLLGLGQMYVDDPRFTANIGQFHPDLPVFMRDAIQIYCERLSESE
jgi:DNA-binding transcriptional MerR regulator